MFVCFFLSCAMQHAGSRPFFNWGWGVLMLSWMSSFMSSSDILFANIFSHSVGCLWWFPSLQKRFSFMRSRLLIFASVALAWGDRSKKYCKGSCQGAYYCLCFLKFTCVHGMRKCSSFVLLHVAIQFSQHHLLKELSLPLCIFCLLHCRLIDCMCVDLFLGSLFCSIGLYICFYAGTIQFWLWSLCNKIWSHFQHTFIADVVTWENNTKVGDLSFYSWSSQSLGHGKVKRILQPSIRGTTKEAGSENKRLWLPTTWTPN